MSKRFPETDTMSIQMVPIDLLYPNPFNPNFHTPEQREELRAEIRHDGQISKPIIARPGPRPEGFEIVDGEQNWSRAKDEGLLGLAQWRLQL